jgi:WD40 repeat protein
MAILTLVALSQVVQAQTAPVRLAHDKPVYAVAFTPDGRTLLSASDDGFVRLWDTASHREVRRWQAHHGGVLAMTLTADGKTIATGGRDGVVRFWDSGTGKETAQFTGGPGDVEGLALSGDGKVLAVSGSGRTGNFRRMKDEMIFT